MNDRIRILQACASFGLGNTERSLTMRALKLPAAWFDVLVVSPSETGPARIRLAEAGVRIVRCAPDFDDIGRIITEYKPHILHYDRGPSYRRMIHTLKTEAERHQVPCLIESNHFGRPGAELGRRAEDLVAHVSLASMLRHARSCGTTLERSYASNHRVVYPPTDVSDFPVDVDRAAARRELGLADDIYLACRVARPDLRKWSGRLESALPLIFTAVPNLVFAMQSAPGEIEARLRRRHGSRLMFLPPTSSRARLACLYAASDLMIHSSGMGESFGASLVEGMFCGLPVIVDATPGRDNAQVEVVDHDCTGIIVNSSRGFAEAARRMCSSAGLRKRMALQAAANAARFSDTAGVRQWIRAYVDTLRRRCPEAIPEGLDAVAADIEQFPSREAYSGFAREYEKRMRSCLSTQDPLATRLHAAAVNCTSNLGYLRSVGLKNTSLAALSRLLQTIAARTYAA